MLEKGRGPAVSKGLMERDILVREALVPEQCAVSCAESGGVWNLENRHGHSENIT